MQQSGKEHTVSVREALAVATSRSEAPPQRRHLFTCFPAGSIPRGLAMAGLSDVDTIAFAILPSAKASAHAATSAALERWRARSRARSAALCRRHGFAAGLELKLLAFRDDEPIGRWLRSRDSRDDAPTVAEPTEPPALAEPLSQAELVRMDAFRICTQGLNIHGERLEERLPRCRPRPLLATATLPAELQRAEAAVSALLGESSAAGAADSGAEAVQLGRWALKRALRSGMELVATAHGGFSRDLLCCHRAIAQQLGAEAASHSLAALQLACAPREQMAPDSAADSAQLARQMLSTASSLAAALDDAVLTRHFTPLRTLSQLAPTPPLAAWPSRASRGALTAAGRRLALSASRLLPPPPLEQVLTDSLPPLNALEGLKRANQGAKALGGARSLGGGSWSSCRGARARAPIELRWEGGERLERLERVAARVLDAQQRPLLLRGAATELLGSLGARDWNLRTLAWLAPKGARVRVAPSRKFTFVREKHPLVACGTFTPPSRAIEMSGEQFARRLQRELPPVCFGAGERYYLQTDVPEELLDSFQVPPLWRSLGVEQAQPLRLWVSAAGATSPLHFDMAPSFLAQARGSKRFTLFAPEALRGLYPYPLDHPLHRRSRVDLYEPISTLDERFPDFRSLATPLCRSDTKHRVPLGCCGRNEAWSLLAVRASWLAAAANSHLK